MIIKRIARFVRTQDWNAIAIEFVIVTAGVLMGIQVSNWNDARVEKARVHQQVASLGTELQGNLATIERYQRNVESQLVDLIALQRSFDRPGSTEAQTDTRLMNVFRIGSLILLAMRYGIETQKLKFANDLERATEKLLALLRREQR